MPTVETTTWINAPIEIVYEIAKDNRSFPEFMKDLDSLTVVSEEGNVIVSDYVGVVSAFNLKVKWQQEDVWDDTAKTCTFRQLKGDYDSMSGLWSFREENGGTRFESTMDYEYSVPGLGPMVGKVIFGLVKKNVQDILDAIRDRAESKSGR
jgi:uncharacterized membrane protein